MEEQPHDQPEIDVAADAQRQLERDERYVRNGQRFAVAFNVIGVIALGESALLTLSAVTSEGASQDSFVSAALLGGTGLGFLLFGRRTRKESEALQDSIINAQTKPDVDK